MRNLIWIPLGFYIISFFYIKYDKDDMNRYIGNQIRMIGYLLLALVIIALTGCAPTEPIVVPPCKYIHTYDQNGKNIMDILAPGQMVGTFVTCDMKRKVFE